MVSLWCAVCDDSYYSKSRSSYSVLVLHIYSQATVDKLKQMIFDRKRYNLRYSFDASELQLYVAKPATSPDGSPFLKDNAKTLRQVFQMQPEHFQEQFTEMRASSSLYSTYFEKSAIRETPFFSDGDVHVLVELPANRTSLSPSVAITVEKATEHSPLTQKTQPTTSPRTSWSVSHSGDLQPPGSVRTSNFPTVLSTTGTSSLVYLDGRREANPLFCVSLEEEQRPHPQHTTQHHREGEARRHCAHFDPSIQSPSQSTQNVRSIVTDSKYLMQKRDERARASAETRALITAHLRATSRFVVANHRQALRCFLVQYLDSDAGRKLGFGGRQLDQDVDVPIGLAKVVVLVHLKAGREERLPRSHLGKQRPKLAGVASERRA